MSAEKCLICERESIWKKVFDIPDDSLEKNYTIVECPYCQIKKTIPIPPNLNEFYPVNFFDKPQNQIYHFAKGILIKQEIKRVHKFTRSKSFLDIGAGYGDFSEKIHLSGYSVVAADNSPIRPYYIQSLKEVPFQHFNYEPLCMDAPQDIRNRVVILRHVLEHIKDPRIFLSFFISHQASHFYIVVPNASCLERKVFRQYDSFWFPPYHLWHFNKNSLKTLLEGIGIKITTMGFDTIPTILPHIYYLMKVKRYPELIREWLKPTGAKIALTMPLNLFFPNNVLWAIAQTK